MAVTNIKQTQMVEENNVKFGRHHRYASWYPKLNQVIRDNNAFRLYVYLLSEYQFVNFKKSATEITDRFNIAVSVVEKKTRISKNSVSKAGAILESLGLVSFPSRPTGKTITQYKIEIARLLNIVDVVNNIDNDSDVIRFACMLEDGDFDGMRKMGYVERGLDELCIFSKSIAKNLESVVNPMQHGESIPDLGQMENVSMESIPDLRQVAAGSIKSIPKTGQIGGSIPNMRQITASSTQSIPNMGQITEIYPKNGTDSIPNMGQISKDNSDISQESDRNNTCSDQNLSLNQDRLNMNLSAEEVMLICFMRSRNISINSAMEVILSHEIYPKLGIDLSLKQDNPIPDLGQMAKNLSQIWDNYIILYKSFKKDKLENPENNPEDETGNKTNKGTSSNEENSEERSFEKEPKQLIEESDDSISVLNKYLPSYKKAEEENLENETERVVGNYSEFPYLKNFPMLSEGQRVNIARVIREVREILPAGTEISETKLEELFNSIAEDYFDETHDKAVFDLGMDRVFVFTETVTRGLLRMYYNKSEKRDEKELMEEFFQLPKTETLSEDVLGLSDFDKADWLREKFLSTFGEGEKNQFTLSDASGFISAQMINLGMFRFRSLRYDSQDMLEELFSNKLVASDVDQKKYYVRSSRDEVVSSFSASDNKKLGIEEEITGSKIDAYEDVSDAKMLKRHNWVLEELEGLEWPETKSVVNDGVISGRAVLPVVFRKLLLNDNDEIPSTECFAICAAIRKHYGVSGYKLGGFDDLEYFIKGDYDNGSDFSVTNVNFSPSRRQRRR